MTRLPMPWPCYMVEYLPACPAFWRELGPGSKPAAECRPGDYPARWDGLRPGAMWWQDGDLCVKLPGGSEWNIDRGRLHFAAQSDVPKWTRAGEPPHVTATPSINHVGVYHGWLRDGVLTDDCEGRQLDYQGQPTVTRACSTTAPSC